MLDCISEGRMVAGFPVGLGGDFAHSYGFAPMEQRGRYREAHELITKAWQAEDVFAWNGKYYQLPHGQYLAPARTKTPSADLGAGKRQPQHLGLCPAE